MDNNTFEIHDDEIDVEEIMQKIRENIRRRKEAGIYPKDPVSTAAPLDPTGVNSAFGRDLAYLSGNWNIQNNSYFISSHRPYVGKYLVKGRELVHGEVRRYADPVIWKQAEFNRATSRVLEEMTRQVSEIEPLRQQIHKDTAVQIQSTIREVRSRLKERLQEQNSEIRTEISEVGDQIRSEITELVAQVKAEIAQQVGEQIRKEIAAEVRDQVRAEVGDEIRDQVQSAFLAMDADIENRAWLAKVLEGRAFHGASRAVACPNSPSVETGLNYFAFEERFRGSREDIKERQRAFVRYFEGCSNVLDIGCGRGEFLELMQEKGIKACGVDLDETMVDYCRSRGLEVKLNDAVSYLEQLEDSSLDGVFIDQVVEHLKPAYLIRLLELCYRKMKYGDYIVAETVNPLSFASFANFYIDMTHVRPVHPETMRFLLESAGFKELEVQFSAPILDEARLRKLPVDGGMCEAEREQAEIYNWNVDLLNGTLYGAQDYTTIGKK
jgi:2-polyprenyl-3-methyl-5-hydroxy-6-metoxy-1,4-benzoquinol methylase